MEAADQITFSEKYATSADLDVIQITDRAVFTLEKEGMPLIEFALGIDLHKDILDQMGFKPIISRELKEMPIKIFKEGWKKLKQIMNGSKTDRRQF